MMGAIITVFIPNAIDMLWFSIRWKDADGHEFPSGILADGVGNYTFAGCGGEKKNQETTLTTTFVPNAVVQGSNTIFMIENPQSGQDRIYWLWIRTSSVNRDRLGRASFDIDILGSVPRALPVSIYEHVRTCSISHAHTPHRPLAKPDTCFP